MQANTKRVFDDYQQAAAGHKAGLVAATGGARFASYSDDEIAALPADAVASSYGCGNPLAFSLVRRGQAVLDLGCGAGIDLMLAADRVGSGGHVIGVDHAPAMIEKARRNIASRDYRNIEIRAGRIEELPVGDASVDWVISNCVINLSNRKDKVFAEICRVLKPGGRMMVSDIVADRLPAWIRRSATLTSACVAGAISESEYLAGLAAAGLSECQVVDRHFYEPSQLALVVRESLPGFLARSFVGCAVAGATKKLTRSISTQFWSARIHARKPNLQCQPDSAV
jgi:arsenite methyltransferase